MLYLIATLVVAGYWVLIRRIGPQSEGPVGGGQGQDAPEGPPFAWPPGQAPHVFPLFGPPTLGGPLPPIFYPPNPFAGPKPKDDKWYPQNHSDKWGGDEPGSDPLWQPGYEPAPPPKPPAKGKAGINGLKWTSSIAPGNFVPTASGVVSLGGTDGSGTSTTPGST